MQTPDVFNECRYETSSGPSSRVRWKSNRVDNSNFALSDISSKGVFLIALPQALLAPAGVLSVLRAHEHVGAAAQTLDSKLVNVENLIWSFGGRPLSRNADLK